MCSWFISIVALTIVLLLFDTQNVAFSFHQKPLHHVRILHCKRRFPCIYQDLRLQSVRATRYMLKSVLFLASPLSMFLYFFNDTVIYYAFFFRRHIFWSPHVIDLDSLLSILHRVNCTIRTIF